ncbi:MAG: M48 family metallopeptidase [Blastochloris viridis]|uniref:M48 family metallopeptidase n=1 Tax=Blastochloris viridis TaxID=1079 RepID=A0A6N4R7U8_BLAVI|nr:MAG: M48 family metallopeptidase [Blastochloris viridis]
MPVETGVLRLETRELPYEVKRSAKRRRSFGFVVNEAGVVVFTAPRWVRLEQMLDFAQRRESFIEKRLKELGQKKAVEAEKELRRQDMEGRYCELPVEWYRKAGRKTMNREVAHWAARVGVTVAKVRITSGKTVWGSCNSNGEINLSWRLMLVPAELREYVVIHELCHRVHMNHGVRFWRLVEKYCPDYEEKRKRLNKLGGEIG